MGLSRIEPMTSWWKRGRFTTTPAFFFYIWCPPNCIYGVHIQFNIPNILFFFKKIGVRGPRWHQCRSAPGTTPYPSPIFSGMQLI
ncbi:hypothetical protein HanHA89_Chr08g0279141 [Helianthus annuus]|nr:hypothetical protein HanHA89_Chr08g0279141 [Helianthus annuus]